MTYHGIVHNGVVVLESSADLADGTAVEVIPRVSSEVKSESNTDAIRAAQGLWKDRTDLPADASEAADYLRKLAWRAGDDY